MEIYFNRGGKEHGPYSKLEIQSLLKAGELTKEDLVWYEGLETWTPIGSQVSLYSGYKCAPDLVKEPETSAPPPPAPAVEVSSQPREKKNRPVEENPSTGLPAPTPPRGRILLFRSLPWILVALFLYGIYPYYTVFALRTAFKEGDSERLERFVDFPAVRQSFKEQIQAKILHSAADHAQSNPFSSGLVAVFGPAVVDKLVDALVTPSGVATIVRERRHSLTQGGSIGEELGQPSEHRKVDIEYAFFTGPASFLVIMNQNRIHLRFTGIGWKVYKIEPQDWGF